ncbi:H/ACA ribonucleoprotein complex subunit 2-like protein [Zophobas morio]|uniref:H/ACA ribonucleoprotein complex subunit 2-like protein n=1 Tax=Zophobas morio TaxID=2755281 RepID=UPI0030834D89
MSPKEIKKSKKSKKSKKLKKEKNEAFENALSTENDANSMQILGEASYEVLVNRCSPISKPLANEKLTKSLLKITKKASQTRTLRRGVKEVVKAIRKNEMGIVLIAGDIYPLDVVSHLPIYCEDNNLPYCFVPSKLQLGAAGSTKRPTSCVMIKTHQDFNDLYEKRVKEVQSLCQPYVAY